MKIIFSFLFIFLYFVSVSMIENNPLTAEEKFHIISKNLQEVSGIDKIKTILKERDLKIYWGTTTTGKPHIGYFVPLLKVADFLKAGAQVTIQFSDLHAFLANKTPWSLLDLRLQYYKHAIRAILQSIGISMDKLKFITGTDYQLSKEYSIDVYKITSVVKEYDTIETQEEYSEGTGNFSISNLLYPCLQALDEEYLQVDAQLGGIDQKKIFAFIEKYLPQLGYENRAHLMTPLVPGLVGPKMSASSDDKIDILDSPATIKMKLRKVFCEPGNIKNNALLTFVKLIIFPLLDVQSNGKLIIPRNVVFGDSLIFSTYIDLETAFVKGKIHPKDLRTAVESYLNRIIRPIRQIFDSPKLRRLTEMAYPNQIRANEYHIFN